jgi:hypothetical protein
MTLSKAEFHRFTCIQLQADTSEDARLILAACGRLPGGYTYSDFLGTMTFIGSPPPSEVDALRWVCNHFSHIVSKLAAYERSFPAELCGKMLLPGVVLKQLVYRAQREGNAERPFLRKVTEGDEGAGRLCVLYVSRLHHRTLPSGDEDSTVAIELSDGWYSVPAQPDSVLSERIRSGRISVGTKLFISGMQLKGMENGPKSPLELPPSAHLQIHANGCALARWDAKLGRQPHYLSARFSKRLGVIAASGGRVLRTTVLITRKYGIIKQITGSDGTKRFMSMKAADIEEQSHEAAFERFAEKAQRELMSEDADQIRELQASGASAREVSSQQHQLVESFRDRLERRLSSEMLENRRISYVQRLRIAGEGCDTVAVQKPRHFTLSVWNPADDVQGILAEGSIVTVTNVFPRGGERGALTLHSDRSSVFTRCCTVARACAKHQRLASFYSVPETVPLCLLSNVHDGDDFDCVALLVHRCSFCRFLGRGNNACVYEHGQGLAYSRVPCNMRTTPNGTRDPSVGFTVGWAHVAGQGRGEVAGQVGGLRLLARGSKANALKSHSLTHLSLQGESVRESRPRLRAKGATSWLRAEASDHAGANRLRLGALPRKLRARFGSFRSSAGLFLAGRHGRCARYTMHACGRLRPFPHRDCRRRRCVVHFLVEVPR